MTRILKLVMGCWLAAIFLAVPVMSAHAENSLVWNGTTDRVDADLRGITLWPLLEDMAHKTGWHIFVEPGTDKMVSTKFKNLPSGQALKMVLGDLNFALVPQTNGPTFLYIFRTSMQNATKAVAIRKPVKHVPNQLIVKLKPGANIDPIAKLVGAKVIERNDKLGIYLLQFPDAAATDAALAELKSNPDVESVEYNNYFDPLPTAAPLTSVPSGQTQPALKLDAPSQDNPCNVLVGLIDTPIQSLNAALSQFVKTPISVAGDAGSSSATSTKAQSLDTNPDPITTKQVSGSGSGPTHATGMAQTILRAIAEASGGHTSAQILPVDVYGASETTTSWNVALGIQAAVDKGANVLNLSLGSPADSAVLDSIIKQAEASGILIFAAAGNQPVDSPTYPAAIPGVNAVTAVQSGQLAPYANYGSFIDMALPGANVIFLGDQAYVVEGTSVSTAYATGVAAGTKTSNCDDWPQIQTAMQQKFVVPAK